MSNSSTWGHPDIEGEFEGIQRYAKGDYAEAMKYFLLGARYADKLSQLCIGLLYLNGEGVRKDPVTAYAWLALAAERNYPSFLVTRDTVWAQLDAEQREQARTMVEKLSLEYGDAVAKPRMVTQLGQNMLQGTESHLGYSSGRIQSFKPGKPYGTGDTTACATRSIGGAPLPGCDYPMGDPTSKPNKYFQARDAEWRGIVTVGSLQSVTAPKTPPAPLDTQH
ncbi:tetratricopeptide repeat protein [Dyella silvatica]|uniref:tetratricopeptide repeat protein n=1 Tax=Dyella silvatica TaxID=2992128 RepID=UPI00224FBB48|nr:sel1 repeat family protein [Dyella silvatica]